VKEILDWIVLAVAAFFLISFGAGIRSGVRQGRPPTKQTVNITMLWALSIAGVFALRESPLHLLWLFPISFAAGFLSLEFPFSLLSIPGSLFGRLCCIGLDEAEIARNAARQQRFQALLREGVPAEDARRRVLEEEAQSV